MELMKQTGSMTNWLMAAGTKGQPTPEVGMGATVLGWTDRYAATIIEVKEIKGGWLLMTQEDIALRTDKNGMSECQTYEYKPDPNGTKKAFRFESNKAAKGWREVYTKPNGRICLREGGGYGLQIGVRRQYYDFSF